MNRNLQSRASSNYFSLENNIKNLIKENFINDKKYYDVDYFYSFIKNTNKFSNNEYLKQIIKNILSKMYKNNEIIRVKKGLYTFSTELFQMRDLIEDKLYKDKAVIFDILYDFLNEETQAIPSMHNVYIDESLFGEFSVSSLNLFFEHYNVFKKVKNISSLNDKQLLIFKISIYFLDSKKLLSNELELYILKKMNELNITIEDVDSFNIKNFLLNSVVLIKKKTANDISKKIIRILNGKKSNCTKTII